MNYALFRLRWHAQENGFRPFEILVIDERRFFDAELFLETVDDLEHWTLTRLDQMEIGGSDVCICCIDANFARRSSPDLRTVVARSRFKIAVVPEAASNVGLEEWFDSILSSDDPLSWQAFLHLLTRDNSQLIGVDLIDQRELWRGRSGRLFRRDYGLVVVAQLKNDLELSALNSPISAVQLFFRGWSLGLGELDRVSTELLAPLGDIELVMMAAAAKGRDRSPSIELIAFSDRTSRRIS